MESGSGAKKWGVKNKNLRSFENQGLKTPREYIAIWRTDLMKIKIFTNNKFKVGLLFVLIAFSFYGLYLVPHFAPDTYNIYFNKNFSISKQAFSIGRFITSFLLKPFQFDLKYLEVNNFLITFVAIIVFACSAFSTYCIFKQLSNRNTFKSEIILVAACSLIYFNPYFCDWFQFVEVISYSFSIIIAVLSAYQIVLKTGKMNIFLAIILLFIATLIYQPSIAYFPIMSIIFLALKTLDLDDLSWPIIKKFIIKYILITTVYILTSISLLLVYKVLNINTERGRIEANIIIGNISKFIRFQKELWITSQNTYPEYFIICIIILFVIAILYNTIQFNKNPIYRIIILTVACLSIILFTIIPVIAVSDYWPCHRVLVPIMCLPSALLLFFNVTYKGENVKEPVNVKNICNITAVIFMIISLCITQKLSAELLITNSLDLENAKTYMQSIENYEKATGNRVDKIAFFYDAAVTWSYPNILATYDLNKRAMVMPYSQIPLLEYASGRKFNSSNVVDNAEVQEKIKKDWTYFSEDQIVFEKDSAYIILY
jgi:hypothetical protein